MKASSIAFVLASLLGACAGQERVAVAPPSAAEPRPVVSYRGGLAAPESVLYDAENDRYLVSNVNGGPLAKDGNGFISILSPEGTVVERAWIEGGKGGATLDAPKGLALSGGVLYVTDLSTVRTFDAKTGAPRGDIAVPGTTSLTGVTATPDGTIYVSDSGPPTGEWDGRGTEAVYVLDGTKAKLVAKGDALGRPEAVAWSDKGLVVGGFGSDEVYRLDKRGAKSEVTRLPAGGVAGIVSVGDTLLVTSFQASSVFRGKLGGRFELFLPNQSSPAGIGYDTKRARLLVPHFNDNNVEAFALR